MGLDGENLSPYWVVQRELPPSRDYFIHSNVSSFQIFGRLLKTGTLSSGDTDFSI